MSLDSFIFNALATLGMRTKKVELKLDAKETYSWNSSNSKIVFFHQVPIYWMKPMLKPLGFGTLTLLQFLKASKLSSLEKEVPHSLMILQNIEFKLFRVGRQDASYEHSCM